MNPNTASQPNGTNFGGYGPNTSPYGSTASASPVPGAAASANGYTTGAYATSQPRTSMGVNSAPYGQLASNQPIGIQQQPSPLPNANQSFNLPSSPVAGPSPQVYGDMTVPRGPSSIASAPGGAVPPTAVPSGYSMPQPGFTMPQPAAAAFNGLPVARSASAQGLPAMPVSSGTNLPPGIPPDSQMPVAYGGSAPSSMPVMSNPASSGTAPYLPGSVGRNTPYNFSNQGPGAVPAAPTPSFPRTATDPYANPNR